jgi:hypothetical protein
MHKDDERAATLFGVMNLDPIYLSVLVMQFVILSSDG